MFIFVFVFILYTNTNINIKFERTSYCPASLMLVLWRSGGPVPLFGVTVLVRFNLPLFIIDGWWREFKGILNEPCGATFSLR